MRTLSLVVPVYNAPDLAARLVRRLPELADAAKADGFALIETILVDDGSRPPLALGELPPGVAVLVNGRNRGKGFSVRRAALASRGEYVLMSDVDLSTPFSEFAALAKAAGAWMVCGSRHGRPGMPWIRKVLSRLCHFMVWLAGVRGIQDTQCGFKLFRMARMRGILERLRTDRFAFDIELICRVQDAGGTVAEVPVLWQGGARSSLCVFRDAPRMLFDIFRIRRRRRS
ncbi:MAG: glycosyltransferase [Kiritimatiellia bacterium]